MLHSLRLRLALVSIVLVLAVLGVLWIAIGGLFIDNVIRQFDSEMNGVIDSLAARVVITDGRLTLPNPPGDPRFEFASGGRYWQIDGPDGVELRSRSLWDVDVNDAQVSVGRQPPPGFHFIRVNGPAGQAVLFVKRDISLDSDGKTYRFTVWAGFDNAEMLAPLDRHYRRSRIVMLTVGALLLGLVLLQPVIVLHPLSTLKADIGEIRSGARSRLRQTVASELLPLVDEINLLLEEREQAVEKARARASDLAHGLKTPLTVLSQLAQQLPAAERENALQQVELVRQRADRQLQAARLGVGAAGQSDVAQLVQKLVAVLRPVSDGRGIEWKVNVDPGLRLDLDPSDLVEALGNVLDNAVKWTDSLIVITAGAEHHSVVITVDDDGQGVPPEHRQTVLRRGEQLSDGREGSGLGLAISCDVVEAYGGSLSLKDSPNGGLRVLMQFPQGGGRRLPVHPA